MALIQSFEIILELSWKTLKDYLESEGLKETTPRQVIRRAYQSDIINHGEIWLIAIEKRNETSHIYEISMAQDILVFIEEKFVTVLKELFENLKSKL